MRVSRYAWRWVVHCVAAWLLIASLAPTGGLWQCAHAVHFLALPIQTSTPGAMPCGMTAARHHWQDATHITFGVATAGLNFGSKVKLEGSDFTGREPNENRTDFDTPRWDSYSGRLSYNPDTNNALQISYGYIRNPEGDGINQHRITASWLYDKPLGTDANFTTALVWGQNNLTIEGRSNSFLAEADYQKGWNTFFTRVENIQKSGHELALPSPYNTDII